MVAAVAAWATAEASVWDSFSDTPVIYEIGPSAAYWEPVNPLTRPGSFLSLYDLRQRSLCLLKGCMLSITSRNQCPRS